jgi:predicted dithiol-disulfide oxidoreductase (DUF899 family)
MKASVVSREEWLEERMALLRREKSVTRELDLLALERQKMPWVAVEKPYQLEIPEGTISLLDLFGTNSQLIVYHFMYGPDWSVPCDGCSGWADAFNGTLDQIQMHDANLIAVSHAPIDKLEDTRKSRNWSFQWASSFESDFNSDFHMSAPQDCKSVIVGDELITYDRGESGGVSVFIKNQGRIFHTYSCYNRGIQQLNGAFGYVDLLPLGGN